MKIGLISINMYSKALNYACPLHNYAFQQFLLRNGIESTVISYYPVYFSNFDLINPYKYYSEKVVALQSKVPKHAAEAEKTARQLADCTEKAEAWEPLQEQRKIRYEKFQNFIDTRYIKTDETYNSDLLEIVDPGFDCYICVTDVIWKDEPGFGFDRGFFLGSKVMENKWKIAYSASRGAHKASPEKEAQFFRYINDIDFISVREKSLKKYIEEKSDKKAQLVLDPVFLNDADFYKEIAVLPEDEHYILVYGVVEKITIAHTIAKAADFARRHNLKIIELTDRPLSHCSFEEYEDINSSLRFTAGIEEWLGYILKADYVFTNSFHASCFSIIFQKELFAGPRKGDKVRNLLKMFGMTDRIFTKDTDFVNGEFPPIDYSYVRRVLKKRRAASEEYILSAIRYAQTHEHPQRDYTEEKKNFSYPLYYHSGKKEPSVVCNFKESDGILNHLSSGSMEFYPADCLVRNDGSALPKQSPYSCKGHLFYGWYIRYRIDNQYFWYLEDGSSKLVSEYNKSYDPPRYLVKPGEPIPHIPVNHISSMIAEAVWKKYSSRLFEDVRKNTIRLSDQELDAPLREQSFPVFYHSGKKGPKLSWTYEESPQAGSIITFSDKTVEYHPKKSTISNNGQFQPLPNQFSYKGHRFIGWYLHFTSNQVNRWFLIDGSTEPKDEYNEEMDLPRFLVKPGESFPFIPEEQITALVAVAAWEETLTEKIMRRLKIRKD